MKLRGRQPVAVVWALLVGATLISFTAAEVATPAHVGVAVVLAIAAAKVRLILRHFMDLKDGPVGWRIFFEAWTAACALMILGLRYAGGA